MRRRIFIGILLLIIGGMFMPAPKNIETSPSTTLVYATRFLEVRSGSDKTNLTLTHQQLMAFKDYVFAYTDDRIDGLHDVDYDKIIATKNIIAMDLEGLTETQFANQFQKYYAIYEDLFRLYGYALESNPVEGRGQWHRPFESNLEAVRKTLSDLEEMGINMLYVETFWMGRLIYNSNVPDTFQHGFTLNGYADENVDYGTNLLKAFVEEGKNYGIEVHAWVENFFVGFGTDITGSPILQAKPEWASYNYDGTIPQKFETNYLFMDPANPETRDYLKAIYVEMAQSTDIASIHLDYIRYPVSQNQTSTTNNRDTGYSVYAERAFKYQYGYVGDLRELVVSSPQAARDWQAFKTQIISDFVAGVYYRVKNANSNVYLSTAIFGNVQNAIQTKNQDWASWVEDGYVELILPMAYYQSSTTVRNEVGRLTDLVGNNAFSYAGIAPSYMGYNDYLNTAQIDASISGNAQGVTFFATQNYIINHFNGMTATNQKAIDLLNEGVFRNKAIIPHGNLTDVMAVSLNTTLTRAENIYLPNNAMTTNQLTLLEDEFNEIKLMPHGNNEDLEKIIDRIIALDINQYASYPANNRINESLNYLVKLLEIRLTRNTLDASIDLSVNPDQPINLPPLKTLNEPSNFRVDGDYLRWDSVLDAQSYDLRINGQVLNVNTPYFDLKSINLFEGITQFEVKAIGDGVNTTDSDYTEVLSHEIVRLDSVDGLHIINNVLYFNPVENATRYRVRIGTSNYYTEDITMNLSDIELNNRTYSITVVAEGNGYKYTNSRASTAINYRAEATAIETLFKNLFVKHGEQILKNGE